MWEYFSTQNVETQVRNPVINSTDYASVWPKHLSSSKLANFYHEIVGLLFLGKRCFSFFLGKMDPIRTFWGQGDNLCKIVK